MGEWKFYERGRLETSSSQELYFYGGVSETKWLENGKDFSRNHRQGYRVYDVCGIANALTSNGGGYGGCSGLYLIPKKQNLNRGN